MKVIKPQLLSVLQRPYEQERKFYLCVTTMACISLEATPQFFPERELWKLVGEELGPKAILDMGMPKPVAEVVLHATVFAPDNSAAAFIDAGFSLGNLSKKLRIWGERSQDLLGRPSAPLPFVSLPIGYENAYGGPEFAANPIGIGSPGSYATGAKKRYPRIEAVFPAEAGESAARPVAGFGPLDPLWPQRAQWVGTYDAVWYKQGYPGLASDLNWRFFCVAPEDQRCAGFLVGDESFTLTHLHPAFPELYGKLPSSGCRVFIQRTGGEPELAEVKVQLDTVWLFPHRERGILMFRSVVKVDEDDAADVGLLMVASEDLGSRRNLEYYQSVLTKRLDKESAPEHVLKDEELMHQSWSPKKSAMAINPWDQVKELMGKRVGAKIEEMQGRVKAAGLDWTAKAPEVPWSELGIDPNLPPVDLLREIEAKRKANEPEILKKQANAAQALERFSASRAPNEPPVPDCLAGRKMQSPSEKLAAIRDRSQKQSNDPIPFDFDELSAVAADAHAASAKFPPIMTDPRHEAGERRRVSDTVRDEVIAKLRKGETLDGYDLRGIVIQDVDLTGARFGRANLEGAEFFHVNLRNSDVSSCNLAKVRLVDVCLDGAKGVEANLADSELSNVSMVEADFRKVILHKARLRTCNLTRATFAQADFSESWVENVAMAELIGNEMCCRETDFVRVNAAGARLEKALFMNCRMDTVDFSSGNLERAVVLASRLVGVIFRKAQLHKVAMVLNTEAEAADFTEATVTQASMRATNLRATCWENARLDGSDLSESCLERSSGYHLVGRHCLFIRTNFRYAEWIGSNLMGSLFQKAHMQSASFRGANLFGTDFTRVCLDGHSDFSLAILGRSKQIDLRYERD